jgi:hypothetical protein
MRRHDPERTVFLQPRRALVAQQRAADLAGIVPRADAYDFESFGMLVSAELIGQEAAHAIDDRLCIGGSVEFEDGVDALSKFGIGQADNNAGPHIAMRRHRSLDLGRTNIRAAAQDHVGEPIAKIKIAVGIEPADIAKGFPAVGTTFRLGAELVIGAAGTVRGEKKDFAGLAGRNIVAILADDPQRRRFADPAD